jgi:hypothetical protein
MDRQQQQECQKWQERQQFMSFHKNSRKNRWKREKNRWETSKNFLTGGFSQSDSYWTI